jgi:hypothetical protein
VKKTCHARSARATAVSSAQLREVIGLVRVEDESGNLRVGGVLKATY